MILNWSTCNIIVRQDRRVEVRTLADRRVVDRAMFQAAVIRPRRAAGIVMVAVARVIGAPVDA